MKKQQSERILDTNVCSYWCEFFGLTAYTSAIFGLGLAVF